MYQYVNSIVRHRHPNVRFEDLDVRTISVKHLLSQYAETYIVLTHPSITGPVTLVLSEVVDRLTQLLETTTFDEWLTANGSDTLPVHPGTPHITKNAVLQRDAWQAGYKVDICVPIGNPNNDANDHDKTDIWLTRDGADYQHLQKYCLGTVNGLVHRMDADNLGLYLKDGTASFRKTGNAHVGLLSFLNVGEVHTASITADMIYQPDQTKLYSEKFYLKVPFNTGNKVMGIVIGGYLHLGSNEIKVVGENTICVDMKKVPFLERYMESRYVIDMSSMERFHDVSETNESDYDLQGFYSNESILELMTLSQSFIVGIETDHLNRVLRPLERSWLPGRYYSNERPLFPMRANLGAMPAYLSELEVDKWVLRLSDDWATHRFYNTAPHRWNDKVNERRIGNEPFSQRRASLVEWYTNSIEIK